MAKKNQSDADVDVMDDILTGDAENAAGEDSEDSNKTPRERFVDAATRRLNLAENSLRKIGRMHTTPGTLKRKDGTEYSIGYEYSDADVDKIEQILQAALSNAITLLRTRPTRGEAEVKDYGFGS
jgi:hypothetical protein